MELDLPPHLAASVVPGGEPVAGLPDHVRIRQFYLGCLSLASYLVEDVASGRAVAVDPRRDVDELVAAAAADGVEITHVLQTHFHADFLSGHLELAAATGAEIGYGDRAVTEFESRGWADGETLDLGRVQLEIWHTPGHTPESISILVRPEPGADPVAVLTGDTLFVGDVGRPDLLVALDVPAEDLAREQYRSLARLAGLPDEVVVLPAHGAGSACGKALSTETVSTIGAQRRENWALQPMTVETFVERLVEGQPTAPGYFVHDAVLNRKNRPVLGDETAVGAVRELDLAAVDRSVADGARLIDVRPADEFVRGHLAGSVSIPLGGRFAEQLGMIIDAETPVVIVGDEAAAAEARVRMSRIGFDRLVGWLPSIEAVLVAHPGRAAVGSRLTASAFAERREQLADRLQIVDVRNPGEVEAQPLPGARNVPLASLLASLDDLDPAAPTVVVCAGGARSSIAASVLAAEGFADVSDVVGGVGAIVGT